MRRAGIRRAGERAAGVSAGPRVSAIVIFLDEARFIAEAIESVRAQTYGDWELILVDDGSTDASTAIARGYAAREPQRIRYAEHPGHANRGMSAARNLGVSLARGEFVGFLDADDVWLPAKLQEQVAIFDAHPEVQMVYGRTQLWNSWRDDGETDGFCDLGFAPDSVVMPPALLVSLIENRVQTPTTCNALMRRGAIERAGGFEASFRGMFEDQVFFLKLAAAAPVYVAAQAWARYRQRDDSSSAREERSGQVRASRRRMLGWLERYLRGQDLQSPAAWRALRREQRAARWPRLHALLARAGKARKAFGSDAAV
jgi:glycosyltransferase involved in cell wall biosynthesis